MPLRKSPAQTLALLAANRANARKGTGPRTAQGKALAALNALKNGRYATALPELLLRAGQTAAEEEYRWFRSEIAAAFCPGSEPPSDREQREAERLAAIVWTRTRRKPRPGTNPESPLSSTREIQCHPWLSRIQIVHRPRRVGLVFWLQRRRYWTFRRVLQVLFGGLPVGPTHAPLPGCEARWRRRIFHLGPPPLWERIKLEQETKRRSGRPAGG